MLRIYLLMLLFAVFPAHAYQSLEIELDTGNSLTISEFQGEGETLLVWLPSERGLGQGYFQVALDLAAMDTSVWAVNLHESYIIPTGRGSFQDIDMEDLLALIKVAEARGFKQVYLLSTDRGAQLTLDIAYLWQQQHPQSSLLRGQILFSPQLVKGRTEMGMDAQYIDVSSYSNLPVYLIVPQYSTKFARAREISQQLAKGGSQVFIHRLKDTQGGFHMRPEEDLKPADIASRENLAQLLQSAIRLMQSSPVASIQPGYQFSEYSKVDKSPLKVPELHAYKGNVKPQGLKLKDVNGNWFDLEDSKGEVVLVNFWATWCGPCVEEVPSLSRLVTRMKGSPFRVAAVNIGESAETIRQFTREIPVNFDILLDSDGDAVRDWKVYAYPSNYLIDREGNIRYAYRGALEWDAPGIIQTIQALF